MKTVYKTDCGKHRSNNEDNVGVFKNDRIVLAVVADGMGGEMAGEVASSLALEHFTNAWESLDDTTSISDLEEWLEQNVTKANRRIYDHSKEHPECQGMGTTIVAALCTLESVVIANVGDSRCYFISQAGDIKQITEDHSLVNQLLKAGQLSEDDAEHHPMKHVIMRAAGTDPDVEVDIYSLEWTKSDRLILCSDGLSDMLNKTEIASIVNNNVTIEDQAEQLIAQANLAGGEDNITLTIVVNDDGEGL